jgi:hypothetical protein
MLAASEREFVLNYLAETRAELLRIVEDFPANQFHVRPAEDRWSAAETLEHVLIVERRALARIQATLQEPAPSSGRSQMEGRDEELLDRVRIRGVRVPAPPFVLPTGGQDRTQLVSAFKEARQATAEFARATDADLRHHLARHPLFGEIDCYQWLSLIAAHSQRHCAQIAEIHIKQLRG